MLNLFLENKKNSYLFVTIVALIFLLPGTFQLPLLDRDEPRFSWATVEMRENSNWIVPFFNGEFRAPKFRQKNPCHFFSKFLFCRSTYVPLLHELFLSEFHDFCAD